MHGLRRDHFMEHLKCLDKQGYQILEDAAQEYDSDDGSVSGWASMAEFLGMSERDALCLFLMKHIRSITKGISIREEMAGRIVDAMNYLRLLYMHDIAKADDEFMKEYEAQPYPKFEFEVPADMADEWIKAKEMAEKRMEELNKQIWANATKTEFVESAPPGMTAQQAAQQMVMEFATVVDGVEETQKPQDTCDGT